MENKLVSRKYKIRNGDEFSKHKEGCPAMKMRYPEGEEGNTMRGMYGCCMCFMNMDELEFTEYKRNPVVFLEFDCSRVIGKAIINKKNSHARIIFIPEFQSLAEIENTKLYPSYFEETKIVLSLNICL